MKKLLLFLLIALCASCTKVEVEVDPEQGYTSFTFVHHETIVLPECVIGYYKDGLCIKIAELGELPKDKVSPEIVVEDPNIVDIYFFTDYRAVKDGEYLWVRKLNATYTLRANMKNNFEMGPETGGIMVDKYDPAQYPH